MFGWIVRGLLVVGGTVASWFMSREAFQFPVMQFVAALFVFVLIVAVIALWPAIKRSLSESRTPRNND